MVIFFSTCVHCQTTTDCPDWTSGNIENPIDYYYGIGHSEKTSEDADDKARTDLKVGINEETIGTCCRKDIGGFDPPISFWSEVTRGDVDIYGVL